MIKRTLVKAENLKKSFKVGAQNVEVLHGLDFTIESGDFTLIFGPSGCGKSTLLHIILGLEVPTEGSLTVLNKDLYANTTKDDRSDFRKSNLGMIFQQSNWVKSLTVHDNVAFPLLLLGYDHDFALDKAKMLLEEVGMYKWADYIPTELSGGQQQRISLARALINDPKVIVADEPTGSLDYEAGVMVMSLLEKLCKEKAKSIIMVTHNIEYISYSNKAIQIHDGNILRVVQEEDKQDFIKDLKDKSLSMIVSTDNKEDKE
jgi:putative ABC transport system ATP-binding protein